MTRWAQNVNLVEDGESVDAAVVNRPLLDLKTRTDYLKEQYDLVAVGSAVVAKGVACDPDLGEGTPVYWNTTNSRFEAASVALTTSNGALVLTETALVLGVIQEKPTTSTADVVLYGRATIDLDAVVDATVSAGLYHLSTAEAGKLTLTRPRVSIPVLFYDGVHAYVFPTPRFLPEEHVHYRFELRCSPAGTASQGDSGEWVIDAPDAAARGWLPADHASFDGQAPAGAWFGYNLATHTDLQQAWPPVPVAAAELIWNKGQDHLGGTYVPLGSQGLVVVDAAGIWWMSNDAGDVPWPSYVASQSLLETISSSPLDRTEEMSVVLHFAKVTFAVGRSAVSVSDYVETLFPGVILDPPDDEAETYSGLSYRNMPLGEATDVSGHVQIPAAGLPTPPQVSLRFRVLGVGAGDLPSLTLGIKQIPRGTSASSAIPSSYTSVSIPDAGEVDAYGIREFDSSAFDVDPGDLIVFKLSRGSSDGYGYDVGVLTVAAVLEP